MRCADCGMPVPADNELCLGCAIGYRDDDELSRWTDEQEAFADALDEVGAR